MAEITINQVASILKQVKRKHKSACTFGVQAYGDDLRYETYIAEDINPKHRITENNHDALSRLEDFLAIDDLPAHNKQLAELKLEKLKAEIENLQDERTYYEKLIAGDNNDAI